MPLLVSGDAVKAPDKDAVNDKCVQSGRQDLALAKSGRRATRGAILRQSLAFSFVVGLFSALDAAAVLAAPADGSSDSSSASSRIRLVIPPGLQVTGVDDINLAQPGETVTAFSDQFCLQGTAPLGYRLTAESDDGPFRLRNAEHRALPYQVRYRADLRQEGGELLAPGTHSRLFRSDRRADACQLGRAVAFDLELSPEVAAHAAHSVYSGSLTLTLVVE